jgi:uncharacterized membrane protein
MDTTQTNRITMFKTVSAYLNQNNSIWAGMAPMAAAVLQFNEKIAAIDLAAQKQEMPTSGATLDKAAAREALEDVLFLMSQALGALGHNTKDGNIIAVSVLTPSTLDSMNVEELSSRATNVLTEVNGRAGELGALNVTQANINELTDAINTFNAAKLQPRTAVADRMAQTGSLPSLIRDASGLLRNQVDRMVNLFRRSHPNFVAGYRGARVIVDRAATLKTKTATPPPPPNP